jgi:hypothetical protein
LLRDSTKPFLEKAKEGSFRGSYEGWLIELKRLYLVEKVSRNSISERF